MSRPAAQPTTGASWPTRLTVADGVPPELVTLAHDPQTSGGLLAAVPAERFAAVDAALAARDVEHWWIGSVEGDAAGAGTVALT